MRVCIFSINDSYPKVDREMIFLLKKLNEEVDKIFIASSAEYSEIEILKLKVITDKIYLNVQGYNSSRWKFLINELKKNDVMDSVDELVLVDDSCFGPFYSLKAIFEKMKKWDFWGMTVHAPIPFEKNRLKKIKAHHFLQTYFLTFSKKVIHDTMFFEFWDKVKDYTNFSEYESQFECILTHFFSQKFSWGAYADTTEWESKDKDTYISYLLFRPYNLIKNKQLPFLSKFVMGIEKKISLNYGNGEQILKALCFIKEKCEYNTELIYEYLIHRHNLYILRENLGLLFNIHENKNQNVVYEKNNKVAIFAHLYYEDLFEYTIPFLVNLSKYCDIYIATSSKEKEQIIKKYINKDVVFHIEVNEKRGREWSSYLLTFKKYYFKYEFCCFIHDKKSSQMYFSTVGECFCNNLWENTINSVEYVKAVIEIFEKNNHIGVLVPPEVYHGTYFHTSIDFWTICYEQTREFLETHKMYVPLDKNISPVAIGSVFWVRCKAIEKLFDIDITEENFEKEPMPVDGTFSHMLERAVPYIAQSSGFYTGTIVNDTYVAINLLNYQEMITGILKRLKTDTTFDLTTYYSVRHTSIPEALE